MANFSQIICLYQEAIRRVGPAERRLGRGTIHLRCTGSLLATMSFSAARFESGQRRGGAWSDNVITRVIACGKDAAATTLLLMANDDRVMTRAVRKNSFGVRLRGLAQRFRCGWKSSILDLLLVQTEYCILHTGHLQGKNQNFCNLVRVERMHFRAKSVSSIVVNLPRLNLIELSDSNFDKPIA